MTSKAKFDKVVSAYIGAIGEVVAAHSYMNFRRKPHTTEDIFRMCDEFPVQTEWLTVERVHDDPLLFKEWLKESHPCHLDLRFTITFKGKKSNRNIQYSEVKTRCISDAIQNINDVPRVFSLNGNAYGSLKVVEQLVKRKTSEISDYSLFVVLLGYRREEVETWVEDLNMGLYEMVSWVLSTRSFEVYYFLSSDVRLYKTWRDKGESIGVKDWRKADKLHDTVGTIFLNGKWRHGSYDFQNSDLEKSKTVLLSEFPESCLSDGDQFAKNGV